MLDLQELQIVSQLIDNINIASRRLEKGYDKNNAEEFNRAKKEILETQEKISEILK